LSWSRIVLLFNEDFGTVDQLPFDFDRHRVSTYKLTEAATPKHQQAVTKLIELALCSIINADPVRPAASRARSDYEIRRERDVRNLERAFSKIHVPSLETHMDEDPYRILHVVVFCWMDFNSVMSSSQVHFYDKNLDALLRGFHEEWWRSLRYSIEYHPDFTPIRRAFIFMEYDDPYHMERGDRQKHWDEMSAARTKMSEIWPRLLKVVQENYLELDVQKMSKDRWVEYEDWTKKLLE
jgi:hypothetical protein